MEESISGSQWLWGPFSLISGHYSKLPVRVSELSWHCTGQLYQPGCTECFDVCLNVIQYALQWRHNDHDGVSNQQRLDCLLSRLFRRRSKKTSKLRVTGLCEVNLPVAMNSSHKKPITLKMFPFYDVIMRVWQPVDGSISSGSLRSRKEGLMKRLQHDDVIKWKNFPCYWHFVMGIHRSPVDSPHKGQLRGALMFSLMYT